jgi:hypothetical protein
MSNRTQDYRIFKEYEGTQYIKCRYWNTGNHGISVVAVITKGVDWTAYIGADDGYSELACLEYTSKFGNKLLESDARHFFGDINLPYRH